ncbi:hypothetical protein GCM10010923_07400 [Blastomonas marina]|uniref:Lipoprotein n=1 Tax=Blastomonas marina TaxID=1867408 RepID=A0ABQ1F685_9SPHN|nr:hypothetical protein [Blastomonas marina]GGA01246.1 hypothetical protein GCM10010923_07400 [Blastomonas marina]
MRVTAALLAVSLLAACSDAGEDGTKVTTPEGEVTIDDTENGDVRITSKDGKSVSIDQRKGNDAQWPKGFAPYPGATVTSDIAMGGDSGSGKIIAFTSDDTPQQVADFYRRQAEAAGFEIEMELSVNDGRMVAGEKSDGTGFAINASADEEGTSASLTVGRSR